MRYQGAAYYITITLLLPIPLYLSFLCGFFGGGDMNGTALLMPEFSAGIGLGIILIINGILFYKTVLPKYKLAFNENRRYKNEWQLDKSL